MTPGKRKHFQNHSYARSSSYAYQFPKYSILPGNIQYAIRTKESNKNC